MASSPDWFRDSFRSEYDKQDAALGRFTLAIFGKTGVGKSTLINAIFGEEVARTGIGEPVTRGSHLYLDKIGHLGIVDTQGLEVGRDSKEILSELGKAMAQMRRLPLSEQIHVAWYCVRGMDRRFEDTEADFVRRLDEMGLPVLVVLTQVPRRWDAETGQGHFHPDAVLLAEQIMARRLPIAGGRPFMTYAMADEFAGQAAYGLQEVLDATFRVAPEGAHGALVAAQQIDYDRKAAGGAEVHNRAPPAAAGAAAATPIPFSDATLLVPIQLGMMARIAQIYTIKFERAALMAVVSATAATQAGRAAFTGLIKMVPGCRHGGRRRDRGRRGLDLHLRHGPGLADHLPAGGQGRVRAGRRGDGQRAAARGRSWTSSRSGSSSAARSSRRADSALSDSAESGCESDSVERFRPGSAWVPGPRRRGDAAAGGEMGASSGAGEVRRAWRARSASTWPVVLQAVRRSSTASSRSSSRSTVIRTFRHLSTSGCAASGHPIWSATMGCVQ